FRAVVLDCWNGELSIAHEMVRRLDERVEGLEQRIRDYHQAFVVEKTIDSDAYHDMLSRTRTELTVAKIERNEARLEESDVEGVLTFAEQVVGNAAALWMGATANDRLALQRVFFPDGLTWDGAGFGTPLTCLLFSDLRAKNSMPDGMASPPRLSRLYL